MSIAIVALLVLVVVTIVAIPVMISVLGQATRRNPNRPADEENGEGNRQNRGSGT